MKRAKIPAKKTEKAPFSADKAALVAVVLADAVALREAVAGERVPVEAETTVLALPVATDEEDSTELLSVGVALED